MSPKSGAIRGLSARDLPDKPAVKGSEKLYSAIVMPQCVLFDSCAYYCQKVIPSQHTRYSRFDKI